MHLAGIPKAIFQIEYVNFWSASQQNLKPEEFTLTQDLSFGGYRISWNWEIMFSDQVERSGRDFFSKLKVIFYPKFISFQPTQIGSLSPINYSPFELLLILLDTAFGYHSGAGAKINLACGKNFSQLIYNDFLTYQEILRSELDYEHFDFYKSLSRIFELGAQDGMVCFFGNPEKIQTTGR